MLGCMVFIHVLDKKSFLSLYHFASRGPNPSKSTYSSSCKIWVLVSTKKSKTKKKTSKPRNTWRRRRQQKAPSGAACAKRRPRRLELLFSHNDLDFCIFGKMGSNSPLIWGARLRPARTVSYSKLFLKHLNTPNVERPIFYNIWWK